MVAPGAAFVGSGIEEGKAFANIGRSRSAKASSKEPDPLKIRTILVILFAVLAGGAIPGDGTMGGGGGPIWAEARSMPRTPRRRVKVKRRVIFKIMGITDIIA
jgi:hypothetical protein